MAPLSIQSQIDSNKTKTILLMVLFVGFIALLAFIIGKATGSGLSYVGIALIISGLMSLGSYYWGDKLVLAMSGARPADRTRDFDFYTVAENLSIAAGIPKPKLYVIDDTAPNAFATGRDPNHAVIAATTGILSKLDRSELEGVIAHELSHVKNYDTRLLAVVSILVGTIAFISDIFLRTLWWGGERKSRNSDNQIFLIIGVALAIISPLIASLIHLSVSRKREFLADASGAMLTRYPEGLARALEKISKDREVLEVANNATAHLYIINPFKGKNFGAWFSRLFDTHPPIEERVKILRSM